MFVLMNPGGEFAHDSAGTEVWLFDRGQVLDQLGRHKESDEVYRKVIAGQWAPGLQGYVNQAKNALNN